MLKNAVSVVLRAVELLLLIDAALGLTLFGAILIRSIMEEVKGK